MAAGAQRLTNNEDSIVDIDDTSADEGPPPPPRPADRTTSPSSVRNRVPTQHVSADCTGPAPDGMAMACPKPPAMQPTPPSAPSTGRRVGRRAAVPAGTGDAGSEPHVPSRSGWADRSARVVSASTHAGQSTVVAAAAACVDASSRTRVVGPDDIPDLDDAHDGPADLEFAVAAVPLVRKADRVKTIRDLDLEAAHEMRGLVSAPSVLQGVDLSLLQNLALMPTESLMEADVAWDWDVIFTEIVSAGEELGFSTTETSNSVPDVGAPSTSTLEVGKRAFSRLVT
ncbi:hypothetical protein SeLEV6574_g02310 [Synchytrium endobioticum]|uniref:Intraflagellar transport protein 43 n=1 Tax=Synchytrium endobioticum TaxID=286115 RepID=A0A507D8V2_9FUNG|nr:hypothetical protein SeLEV6574_g02310 [Synchytrium endobioticum]